MFLTNRITLVCHVLLSLNGNPVWLPFADNADPVPSFMLVQIFGGTPAFIRYCLLPNYWSNFLIVLVRIICIFPSAWSQCCTEVTRRALTLRAAAMLIRKSSTLCMTCTLHSCREGCKHHKTWSQSSDVMEHKGCYRLPLSNLFENPLVGSISWSILIRCVCRWDNLFSACPSASQLIRCIVKGHKFFGLMSSWSDLP